MIRRRLASVFVEAKLCGTRPRFTIPYCSCIRQKHSLAADKRIPGIVIEEEVPSTTNKNDQRIAAKQVRDEFRESLKKLRNNASVDDLSKYFNYVRRSHYLRKKTRAFGIPTAIHDQGLERFTADILEDRCEFLDLQEALDILQRDRSMEKELIPRFFKFLVQNYPEETRVLASLMNMSDLTSPADWHPDARQRQRKIVLHVGPTNSGKTHAALKRLEEVPRAIYCGPLRLLAHEVYERLNAKGVACNLLTGEEKRESDGIQKWASTVEMAPLNRQFDVAVIDEIQMLGDQQRGWAWSEALLGLQAEEIHLCGEPSIVPLVESIARDTGDIVEKNFYKRLTSLTVKHKGLGSNIKNLRPGDCIATFSRQNIFAMKRAIEAKTKLKAAVIYGSLPPETRNEQARLFNDPNSGFDVLVASDAIGMGLNLNIGRMIFERVEKWDGSKVRQLTHSQVKQIAGRAGRFRTQFENGEVCTFDDSDMKVLVRAMKAPTTAITSAGVHPRLEQIEAFAKLLRDEPLSSLLDKFEQLASLDGRFFLCNLDSLRNIADLIEDVPLTLVDRYIFVLAPCNVRETRVAGHMRKYAIAQNKGVECSISDEFGIPKTVPTTIEGLQELECTHRIIILYMWLSQRFPETFTEIDAASFMKRRCEYLINQGLANLKFERKRKVKGKNGREKSDPASVVDLADNIPSTLPWDEMFNARDDTPVSLNLPRVNGTVLDTLSDIVQRKGTQTQTPEKPGLPRNERY
ncbi:P-loop containing nucleoside triphosphate hydrolase protein [Gaertneriomyces semiglobifer]|nr:P-loop containing nucleoside triphosphate hydrolase protein [Gaertneriomyces semiglobifer]